MQHSPPPGSDPRLAFGRCGGCASPGLRSAGRRPAPGVTRDLAPGADGKRRCAWGLSAPEYLAYHDEEWGRPVTEDDAKFERITLDAFQSGLSGLPSLRKRESFRAAFAGFRIEAVAGFGERDLERLLSDTGIVRNRAKIEAALANARAAAEIEGGLSALVWSFAPGRRKAPLSFADVPA